MPRRKIATKREIIPDPKYKSREIAVFTNHVMSRGKKSLAEHIVYGAMQIISDRQNKDPVEVFELALENVQPVVEVKSRRIGGATYQVPVEVRAPRRRALAMRWLVDYARRRQEKTMPERLANELLEASECRGSAYKKREDTHRMAEANRAFSHYRF